MSKSLSIQKRAEWEERIRKQQESGLSASRWCREHQISHSTFFYWKDFFFPKAPIHRSFFTELPDPPTTTGVSIEYQGVRILIDKGFDPATLKSCLLALRGL